MRDGRLGSVDRRAQNQRGGRGRVILSTCAAVIVAVGCSDTDDGSANNMGPGSSVLVPGMTNTMQAPIGDTNNIVEPCSGASCPCQSGLTACGAGCVDLTRDALHCGACSTPCATGQLCQGGQCVDPSPAASGSDAAGTGGAGSGSAGTGGAGAGSAGSGGAGSGSAGGESKAGGASALAAQYPCDGGTAGYDVVVTGGGNDWTITGTGGDASITTGLQSAIESAYGRLSGSAGNNATLLVQGDGTVDASAQLRMPSYMLLNVCGTVDVTGTASGSDRSPFYARDRTDIQIPNLTLTGNAQYGMFFRDVSNLHLGDIHIDGTGGLGIRIDSHGSNDRNNTTNITIDHVHVENTGGHGVELYGADGVEIGTVVARSTGDCGLILNDSINATIGLVDAVDAAHVGTGYAAFRTANDNGRYDDGSYPTNIRLGELRASGAAAGRGFFCVSRSGGVEIERFTVDVVGGDPAIFIENCYNVTVASASGSGALIGGRAYIGHNSGNGDASRDVTFQNITLSGGATVESNGATCGRNNQAINVTGGSVDVCN